MSENTANITAINLEDYQSIRATLCGIQDRLQQANTVLKLIEDRDGPNIEGVNYTTYEDDTGIVRRMLNVLGDDIELVTARIPGVGRLLS